MTTIHVAVDVARILPAAILAAAGVAVFYFVGTVAAAAIFGVGGQPGRHEHTSPRNADGDEPRATRRRASSGATGKGVTGE